eukprot:2639879-Amphidinium_carterae.1
MHAQSWWKQEPEQWVSESAALKEWGGVVVEHMQSIQEMSVCNVGNIDSMVNMTNCMGPIKASLKASRIE